MSRDDREQPESIERRTAREALFASAPQLFAAHGFDGATAEMIAAAAGVNKAMINYHFGGKDGLYRALLEEALDAARERLTAVRDAPLPAADKLARYVDAFAALNASRPHFSAMVLREILSGGAHIDEDLLPRFLAIFECVRAIVNQGIRDGEFRPVHPLLTHLGVIGPLVFFFASQPFRQRLVATATIPAALPDPAQFTDHLKDITLRGLRP